VWAGALFQEVDSDSDKCVSLISHPREMLVDLNAKVVHIPN
jgi:hypothetical protein